MCDESDVRAYLVNVSRGALFSSKTTFFLFVCHTMMGTLFFAVSVKGLASRF